MPVTLPACSRGPVPRHCLEWGSTLGASCVPRSAHTESVFTRGEAEAFIREQRLVVETF